MSYGSHSLLVCQNEKDTLFYLPTFDKKNKLRGYYFMNSGIIWMPTATIPKSAIHMKYIVDRINLASELVLVEELPPKTVILIPENQEATNGTIAIVANSKKILDKNTLTVILLQTTTLGEANSLIAIAKKGMKVKKVDQMDILLQER
jgi:hypothetical protein